MPDLAIVGGVLVVVGVLVALSIQSRYPAITVYEFQRGLRYRNGRFVDLLPPGRYRIWRPTTWINVVDVRSTFAGVLGQELVTSDGITVKLSLSVQQRLVDPVKAILEVDDYREATHSTIQIALREVVGGLTGDEVLAKRSEVGAEVLARSKDKVAAFGIELEDVAVRDLMLPAATKRLYAQVVEARQRGLAALEKARGETAALRALANAAGLVEKTPALYQLRLLQQLEANSGNTFVLGNPSGITPVPGARPAADTGADAADS